MSQKTRVTVNGQETTWQTAPGEILLHTLRRQALFSVKHGCESGDCGACTVLVDGVARNTCNMLTAQVDGKKLVTLESLGTADNLHPIQQAFVDCGAVQCGYCTPAMILSAAELLERNPDPTENDVCDALSGNLCRCTGYKKPVEAVLTAAQLMKASAKQGNGTRTREKEVSHGQR